MQNRRRTDKEAYSKYRPSRFFKGDGKWYFCTREGTIEGPYELIVEAEYKLAAYIKVMNSGFVPVRAKLTIAPLEVPDLLESTPLH